MTDQTKLAPELDYDVDASGLFFGRLLLPILRLFGLRIKD